MRSGRILLAADAAHVCNPFGGYGCMSGVLDVGGLADCLIGIYDGRAGDEILDLYAEIRREKFLKYVDARSIKNMNRIANSDPNTVLDTDKFLGILKDLEGDEVGTKAFLLVCLQNTIVSLDSLTDSYFVLENVEHRIRFYSTLSLTRWCLG
jgi:2-polyprenyl-6-methoxyphenol hydroxylase-like FAD-dependent oxidoreductase